MSIVTSKPISTNAYTVSHAADPAENHLEERGNSNSTPLIPPVRVKKSPTSGCETIAIKYGKTCLPQIKTMGKAIAEYKTIECVIPPCRNIGINRSMSGSTDNVKTIGMFSLTPNGLAINLPLRQLKAKWPTANTDFTAMLRLALDDLFSSMN